MENNTEIDENNALIAEFMKCKKEYGGFYELPSSLKIHKKFYNTKVRIRDMKFCSSWDWIMPIVEKIETISEKDFFNVEVGINSKECSIGLVVDNEHFKGLIVKECPTKIESVYSAVVEFCKWYKLNYGNSNNNK